MLGFGTFTEAGERDGGGGDPRDLRERRVGLSWRRASLAHGGQTCRRSHVEDPETDHSGDGQEFVTLAWAE